jgi:chromosome partitioning protein
MNLGETHMKTIAFANQKGGVGKTTSVINCAAAIAASGKSVLMVDLDPQAHLTMGLGVTSEDLEHTVFELLQGQVLPGECLIFINNYSKKLALLPAGIQLSGADYIFMSEPGREYLLKEKLSKLEQKFDYIFIDCPPSLGLLTINAFVAATDVYIPMQCEFLAMHGMKNLLDVIETVQKRLNPSLEVSGIIGTMYDSRRTLNKEVIAKIESHFADKLFKTLIRGNVSLAEAPSFGQDIFSYKPNSVGAEDYRNLALEIMKRS